MSQAERIKAAAARTALEAAQSAESLTPSAAAAAAALLIFGAPLDEPNRQAIAFKS